MNGDDPEAVVHAAKVATEFRQKFHKDVVIDIFCYRRFGHNEGDEPMFTNPIMYKKIKTHKTTLSLYTERLVKDGLIPEGEIEDMKAAFQAHLNDEFEAGKDYKPNKADWLDGRWSHLDKNKDEYVRGETAITPGNSGRGRRRADPRPRPGLPCTRPSGVCWITRNRCSNPARALTGPPVRRWPLARC